MSASQKINRVCSDLTDLSRILGDLGNEKLSQAILELEQIADELKEESEDSESLCIVSDALKAWRSSTEKILSKYTVIVNKEECSKLLKDMERWTDLKWWEDNAKPTEWSPFEFFRVREPDKVGITLADEDLTWYSAEDLVTFGSTLSTISFKEFLNRIKAF